MVTCPVCDGTIDVDEEDIDEGETISCDECGADLKVLGTDPLELESAEDVEEDDEDHEDDEDDEDEEDEDGDDDDEDFLEEDEEEESDEEWH
jgi:alpha-aminoadipate/glutamate carrier protein LysW